MKELEGMIALGKNLKSGSARRGAQIQVEGDTAYITNDPKSFALKLKFSHELGDGSFHANEAVGKAHQIQRRDDQVLFVWDTEDGDTRRKLIKDAGSIQDKVEAALDAYTTDAEYVSIPPHALDLLDSGILTTRVSLKDGKFVTRQLRSDASSQAENETELHSTERGKSLTSAFGGGGKVAAKAEDTPETTVFTQDLWVMRGLLDEFKVAFGDGDEPLRIKGRFTFGATFDGLIAHMIYEV